MPELNLSRCPICLCQNSLTLKTLTRQGETFLWYECQECSSVLMWVGNDQWSYQRVGHEGKQDLLKEPLTVDELETFLSTPVTEKGAEETTQSAGKRASKLIILSLLLLSLFGICIIVGIMAYRLVDGIPLLRAGEPTLSPAEKRGANSDFIFAAEVCNPTIMHWAELSEELQYNPLTVCGSWIDRAGPAVDAMARCFERLPRPGDENLQKVRSRLLQAAEHYQSSVSEVERYCRTGSGNLDSAIRDVQAGTEAFHQATEYLNAYDSQ